MTVLAGSGAVNILNYLFTIVVGRLLTSAEFGEITALFALQLITGVPSATITMLATKFIGQFHGAGQVGYAAELVRRMGRMVKMLGLLIAVCFAILAPFLSDLLHIAVTPILLFAILTVIGLATSLYQGILQGRHQFSHYAWMNIIPTLCKLLLGFAFVALGYSVNGVMAALLIGAVLSAAYGYQTSRVPSNVPEGKKLTTDH